MKLVIDTNIIIAALIKQSKAREIILSDKFDLVSPDFALEEILKYKDYICKKSNLKVEELEVLILLLFQSIEILPKGDYEKILPEAKEIIQRDVKDAPYVACYLALKCDRIWTNDRDYDDIKDKIRIIGTKELLELMEEENKD